MLRSLRKKYLIYVRGVLNRKKNGVDAGAEPERTLVVQLSSLGDACTLMAACREIFSQTGSFDILTRPYLAPLWQYFFPGTEVIGLNGPDWDGTALRHLEDRLKDRTYTRVVATSISPYAAYVASLVPAKKRFGMVENGRPFKGARILFDEVLHASENQHVSQRFRQLFKLAGLSCNGGNGRWHPNVGGEFVLLHPGGKWKPRRWPPDRYAQLAQKFAQKGLPVRILVHRSETDLIGFFRQQVWPERVRLAVTEQLSDLLEIMEKARLFVGNDSGPAHLAALMGVPGVVLWGPGDFDRIRPMSKTLRILKKEIGCRPCRQYIHPERCQRGENICLLSISVDEVVSVAEQQLGSVS